MDGKFYAVKFMKKHEIIKLKQVDHINGERTLMAQVLGSGRSGRVWTVARSQMPSMPHTGWDRSSLGPRPWFRKVAHPYIVSMIGSFKDDRYVFIVMQALGVMITPRAKAIKWRWRRGGFERFSAATRRVHVHR